MHESFSAVCAAETWREMKQFNLVSRTFPLKNGMQKSRGRGWKQSPVINRLFPSFPWPLYQNEVKYSAFDMEMIFHSYANETHLTVFGTRR